MKNIKLYQIVFKTIVFLTAAYLFLITASKISLLFLIPSIFSVNFDLTEKNEN